MKGVYIEIFGLLGVYIENFTEKPKYLHDGGMSSSLLMF